ncbi:MAG: helix-turn-helix domain-containing protein [Clostridiales bacterium]|nr:helix-turn-helix domain-containing protein [Clostridiales bacterium]
MQFNEKLKSLRTKKGISQAELAKNIFLSRSAVAKWENGLGLPSEESLKLLAEYFDVSISDLQSDPIGEDIVIQKNSKLSKQKILITILAVFLVIAAVLSAVFISLNSTVHDEYHVPPTEQLSPGRGLMFTTEKTVSGYLSRFENSDLSPNKVFSPSRTFILPNLPDDYPQITLPKLVMESAIKADGTAVYEEIRYDALTFYATEGIKITCSSGDGWRIYINLENPHQAELTGFVNIKYGNEILSIKLLKVPTPVESVKIQLRDSHKQPKDWIGLTEQDYIYTDVLPYGATYSDYSYTIEKIERPDGSLYSGDLSQYVEIDDYTIKPTVLIEPDSKIYIYATTNVEHVKSNTLVIRVTRIPISSIHFISAGYKSYITAGESEKLFLEVFPSNATTNLLNEHLDITLLTPDIATLVYTDNGWVLTASSDYAAVYQQIKVQISAPNDGYSKIFEWTIDPIPIEKMTIINAETNAELDKITYLYRGDTLKLNAVIYPENASVGHVTYHDFSETTNYGAYISISDDGLLTVSDNAPFNMEIDLYVVSGRKSSKAYRIVIKQRQVETVTISYETEFVEIGTIFTFSVSYIPLDADVTSNRCMLVEDVVGIYISANRVYVSPDAVVGSKFRVVCYYNGIESNILEFTVVESTE